MADTSAVPFHYVKSLSFGVYNSEQIKGLSVKEITNPQTFDTLMHPTFGGLYDPALGPQERDDVCTTCGLGTFHCPGHMGHVSLPLPVYHPLLFTTLFKILKGTCFGCKRMLVTNAESSLLKCQMKLLDKGLVSTAEFLREIYYGLLGKHGTAGDGAEVTEGLEKYTEDALQDAKNLAEPQEHSEVKNVTESRQLIIKRFLRGDFFCSKKCIHCKHVNRQLRTEHSAKIFFAKNVSKISAAALRKKLDAEKRRKAKLALQEGDADYEEPEDDDVTDKSSRSDQQYLTPMEVRNHLRQVWYIDHALLCSIMGMLKMAKDVETCGTDIFFIDVLPVAPSRFRPISKMGDRVFENAQTSNMAKAVGDVHKLREILSHIRNSNKEKGDGDQQENIVISQIPEKTSREKLQAAWIKLQASVNVIMDSDLDKLNKDKHPGVKQLLEKKDGLFRKHMMGKRVNYAARSVISPDPNISTNEIGIPLVFATCLTYPQPVTPWNFQELKQAVINGPKVHPGAVMVEDENGFCIKLSPSDLTSREAIAKQLLTPSAGNTNPGKTKKVYRHLKNGDYLLLNRQPTLHRPSIQAHKARVLPGQKTLRLHYANCKAYNADFDGDEMNAHFPQNEIGRAEAATLASTDYQYLVPKDGTPLAGLLQDHMVSGVKLTIRGRHFNRADYQQLVYSALTDTRGKIKLLPPCFLKPKMLWSGKQVLSTVLMNIIPDNKPPPTLEGKAKTAGRNWVNGRPRQWLAGGSPLVGDDMSESEVVIHKGELLVGVLDKGHYGPTPYGLIHCCYELYGGAVAGQMLTCLARLFGKFLHWLGFTLGVQDILVTSKADRKRHKMMKRGRKSGDVAAAKALGVGNSDDTEAIKRRFQEAQFAKDDGEIKDLDLQMKGTTDDIQNDIVRVVMPFGLEQRFPDNNLQLMVQAGAKGSSVNCMQISCLLGQIELEGHRPPLMMSGQSLPSFLAYDTSPRSGGFVDGRFLTGIRPQEYYFHCMAGREGLIDTAVKTSRSGYLQRCIIKHLEGLVIGYDMTVRDSDSSVVQFQYGEDGIEVQKNQYLNQKQFPFLIANQKAAVSDQAIEDVKSRLATKKKVTKTIRSLRKKFVKWQHKHPENGPTVRISPFLKWCEEHMDEITEDNQIQSNGRTVRTTEACTTWAELKDEDTRLKLEEKYAVHQPNPFLTVFRPDRHFGVTSEKFEDIIERYIEENPDQLVGGELSAANKTQIEDTELRDMLYLKHIQSLAQPGEAVGLTAAQSIGEPSTQMTLNTFHFAGRGEMNVTLGIPRLREILMVASLNIKTPSMDIPLINNSHAKKRAKLLQQKFTKVYLSQVLEDVQLTEFLSIKQRSEKCRLYRIRFSFLPHEMYKEDYYLTPAKILSSMEKSFFSSSVETIKKRMNDLTNRSLLANQRMNRNRHVNEDTTTEADKDKNEEEDDIVDDDFHDNDAAAMKTRERQMEERDYEGEEEEMEEVEEDASSDEEVEAVGEESQTQSDGEEDDNVEKGNKLKKLKNKQREKQMDPARIQAVIGKVSNASAYSYDAEEELWCEITLKFPLSNKKLDVLSIVNAEARRTVVTQTKGISRCFMTTSKKPGEEGMVRLKTEGVNIKEMYNYYDILDVNRLYSNDIHAMANTYGIEAASRVIIKEIRDVFAAYGIEVDYRHLSLVADYMTFEGKYKPFSRGGIESNASPLQKITFETSMNFLKQATIQGASDELKSPSARIVVGQLVKGGTGAFDLLHPL